MRPWLPWSLVSLLALPACDNMVVVELATGAQTFELNATSLDIPPSLRDSGSNTIASIDCSGTGICPSSAEVPVTCEADVCDPGPITVAVQVGDVVDFNAIISEAGTLIRIVDEIEVRSAEYAISPNALTFGVPQVEVLWAPETAVSVDGATLLGTIDPIPAATAVSGEMLIDPAGSMALSDHVLGGSGRVRFFARTRVDVAPGDPFPEGVATATVNLRIRAIGRIID